MKFTKTTLGEISIGKGQYGIGASAVDYSEELYTYLRISDINDDGTLSMSDLKSVDDEKAEQYVLKPNDIVFARTGNSTGRNYFYDGTDGTFVYAGFLIKFSIDPNKVNPKYIKYYCLSDEYKGWVQGHSTGSTRGNINAQTYARMEIILPPREQQDKLVSILDNLELKRKNNEAINRNLSEQAETLFRSWFEAYEPWNGEMPTDWKQGALGDFVTIKRGGSPRPIQEYLSDEGLRWLKISDVSGLQSPYVLEIAEHIIEEGLKKTVYLEAGSLVLSNSATPGIPKILDVDSCIHDGWLYFPESQLSNYFLYLFYKSIRPKLVALGNGSVFTNLKTDILKGYSFSKPDDDTLYKFDKIVAPMFRMMREVARENQRLSEVRDSLLPKLMSGELDVSDLNI